MDQKLLLYLVDKIKVKKNKHLALRHIVQIQNLF